MKDEDLDFALEVTHIAKALLPKCLHAKFPKGACTIWVDREPELAFPATPKQVDQLNALLDSGDFVGFETFRDQIKGSDALSRRFWTEMEKVHMAEEAADRIRQMNASPTRAFINRAMNGH